MKKMFLPAAILFCFSWCSVQIKAQGKVGINTSNPQAMLHVKDSSVLFNGDTTLNAGNTPVSGAGARMMWYTDKAAFRAGRVEVTQWDKDNIGYFSAALGRNTIASGFASTAMGSNNTASGSNSTAMGSITNASGSRSTAIGSITSASGFASTAMGESTTASGNYSTAMGESTTASGFTSTAMGESTTASGSRSTAMGNNTSASGNGSTAMGDGTVSRAFASLTIGRFNDSIAASSTTNWFDTDPVFIIGNGTASFARSNAFVVNKNGNTTINGAASISGNTNINGTATISGNTTINGTASISGNTNITGEVNRTATGAANLVPIAYGSIALDGTINTGTGNFTVTKPATGQYEIVLTGISYITSGFITNVTVRAADGTVRIPVTTSINGDLVIRIYDLTNTKRDTDFHFVVYRP